MTDVLQLLFNGTAIGCIYALIALGFIFAVNGVRVVNMAHGEILMVGGFFAFTGIQYLKLPVLVAYVLALIAILVFGYFLSRLMLKRMVGVAFFSVVVATMGLSMVLSNLAMNVWTAFPVNLPGPFGSDVFRIGGVVIDKLNLLVMATTVIILFSLSWFFTRTLTGRQMRAMSELPDVARLLGLPVGRLINLTFVVSAGLAGVAGMLTGAIYFVSYTMGGFALLKGFSAAVIGGFGTVRGAVIGGLALGIAETMLASYVAPTFKDGFAFVALTIVLLARPKGILGETFSQRV